MMFFDEFMVKELKDFFEEPKGVRCDGLDGLDCRLGDWSDFVSGRQYAIYDRGPNSGFMFLTSLQEFNLYFDIFYVHRSGRHHDSTTSMAVEAVEWYGVKIIESMYEEDKTVEDAVREFCRKVYIDTYLPSKAH